MTNLFKKEEIDIFKELMEKAKVYYDYCEQNATKEVVIDLHNLSSDEDEAAEAPLRDFLDSLDFETVKTIQCIMYLGRDRDYDHGDAPNEILKKQRAYFDAVGWTDKEIEINQIVEKAPLYRYLSRGFEILQVAL